MLEKKMKMKTADVLVMLSWLKGESEITKKSFDYDNVLTECAQNFEVINVEDFIDQLMIDLFDMYDKLKSTTKKELEEKIKDTALFNVLSKEMISESMRSLDSFLELYENLLLETKFDYAEIRGIQKNVFNVMISSCIANEEYEKCIELKEKIKEV